MIKNDRIINSLIYGDAVEKLVKERNIDITEARAVISGMSFNEYCTLVEASADIIPPSGQPLSPGNSAANPAGQQSRPAATAPQQVAGPTAAPVAGKADPRGVQVRNPVTGKMEWMQPTAAMTGAKPGQPPQPGQPGLPPGQMPQLTAEEKDLSRMKHLAGIVEDGSCGGTGAGAIAIAPTSMGTIKRRQPTNEQPKEYTPKEAPKTIVGDTKPAQASGELSANLAARGKKAAGRTNNGFKR